MKEAPAKPGVATILVIDDDQTLLNLLAKHLAKAGFQVITAMNGIFGLQAFYDHRVGLVILDVMMPKMDGWTVCERLREISDVPILLLTAKADERDRLRGFRLGVDDFVTKPFSAAELIARVEAILNRSQRGQSETRQGPIMRGDLLIDLAERRVSRSGELIHLTPIEFRLLAALAERPGHILATETLLAKVWGSEYADDLENVKRYIHYLRQKLEQEPTKPQLIMTERGFGYYLN
jgi:two-component system KDP operon response regulator KdpE